MEVDEKYEVGVYIHLHVLWGGCCCLERTPRLCKQARTPLAEGFRVRCSVVGICLQVGLTSNQPTIAETWLFGLCRSKGRAILRCCILCTKVSCAASLSCPVYTAYVFLQQMSVPSNPRHLLVQTPLTIIRKTKSYLFARSKVEASLQSLSRPQTLCIISLCLSTPAINTSKAS